MSLFIVPGFPLHTSRTSKLGGLSHEWRRKAGSFSRTRFRRFFLKLALTAANEAFRNRGSIRKATDYLARINIENSPRTLSLILGGEDPALTKLGDPLSLGGIDLANRAYLSDGPKRQPRMLTPKKIGEGNLSAIEFSHVTSHPEDRAWLHKREPCERESLTWENLTLAA